MNRVACAALLSTLLALSAAGQSVNWSQGVVYEYDGSGNVKKIGTDTYVYDTGQRLIRGSVAGSQQSYSYDSFGNRTGCQSGAGADCQYGLTILSSTNRVAGRDYDKRGNMEQLPENNTLDYDELGMVRKETGNQRQAYFIYTADDERIAVYDADTQFNSHTWRWTVRGLDKKPLRELTSETSSGTVNFKWTKDQIWRDSVLLASRQLDATASGGVSTYHYHVDHLGTPRQVTSSAAILIGRHDYLPFGPEVSGNQSEPQPQTLKFTGHERDVVRDRPPLDYMHARYYEGRAGRFLSVDPYLDLHKATRNPQNWNRYSYVRNNPINLVDPDGRDDVNIGFDSEVVGPPDPQKDAAFRQEVASRVVGGISWAIATVILDAGPEFGDGELPKTDRPYQRPSGATTPQQRQSVQGKPCEVCGKDDGAKRVAGHKKALVQEHYQTGTIDKQKMRTLDAVRPECPTCSAREGAAMSRYSRMMKKAVIELFKKLI